MLGVVYPQNCEESDLLKKTFNIYKNRSRISQPRPWNDVWKERVKIPETACDKPAAINNNMRSGHIWDQMKDLYEYIPTLTVN